MKKNVRNALAISGLALAIGTSGLTLTASANTTNVRNITHRRTIPGIVESILDDSLTMTKGNKIYTVSIPSTTRVLDHRWNTMPFSDIKKGDKVRISGTISGTNITAQTIRNISLQ